MGFDISIYKANISQTGVIQNNKYDVVITTPGGLLAGSLNNGNALSTLGAIESDLYYRCISASLPGYVLRTSDINRYGIGVLEKMPFSGSYTDTDFQFICDRGGIAYQYWYTWLNYIFAGNGEESGTTVTGNNFYTVQYKDLYATTITVTVYDNAGNPQIQYQLLKAYPIFLTDSRLSWEENNNLLKLSVRVTFREWVMIANMGTSNPITFTGSNPGTDPNVIITSNLIT